MTGLSFSSFTLALPTNIVRHVSASFVWPHEVVVAVFCYVSPC